MENLKVGNRYIVTNWSTDKPKQKMFVCISEVTETHVFGHANSVAISLGLTSSCKWPIELASMWTWQEA